MKALLEKNLSDELFLVTQVFIKKDAFGALSSWKEKITSKALEFPGIISFEMYPEGENKWILIQRFKNESDLKHWQNSPERNDLLLEAKFFLDREIEDSLKSVEDSGECVTEVFLTRLAPGMHKQYRSWASKIQQAESHFPGYKGVYIQAPKDESENWITILRFDTQANLENWLKSETRARLLKEGEHMVKELQSHHVISPFAGWFKSLQKEPPAAWKQTMIVLLVLFPVVMLEMKYLNPITAGLNKSLSTFIGLAISVGLVSWPLVPIAIFFLKGWLSPGETNRKRNVILGTLLVCFLYLLEIAIFWKFLV